MYDLPKHWSKCRVKLVFPALVGVGFFLVQAGAFAQTLDETRLKFLKGEYEKVIEITTKKSTESYDDGWRVLLVKALLTVGRYAEARTNALHGVDDFPASMQLRLLARETALFQNDVPAANRQLNEIKSLIERRGRYTQSGDNLVALGRALLLLGVEPRLALENCFQRAYGMDPPVREAYLASGQLALDKHDFKLAADAFRAGLKKFPDDPDLEAGLAQSFESGDRKEMGAAIEAALAANPRHLQSLLLLANHLIDAEQYDEAQKQLEKVLAVNPWRPEALAYRAVLAELRNDADGAEKFRTNALKFWKTNPQVDYLIGLKLAHKYRFEEGAAAQRRALAFEPGYVPARRELAEDLLRLGQVDEGWKLAAEARAQDEYDVVSYNLSTLHDQMAKFRTLTNADFILRMSPLEAQLYGDRALELLGRAKAALCAKYGVELKRPTVVEIFPEQKDFAVRTFGMPGNPGYLGVCFGSVITANSPASQAPNPENWQDVLWHEFCHVVTLNDTKNRMPRWLSEGISVYEERQADPAWGERMNLAYHDMILDGKLTPLGELSGAFMQSQNAESLQFAYYESLLVVEFIVQKFGLPALKQILIDLRDGKEINPAIAAHTAPLADLEKQFAAFAREQADKLAPGVDLEKPPKADPEKRSAGSGRRRADKSQPVITVETSPAAGEAETTAWEKQHTNNYHLKLREAYKLMDASRWADAEIALEKLAQMYRGESRGENPLWLKAIAERNLKDTNAEWAALQQFAVQEADFVDLFQRLIELAGARKDWPAETKYAERLLQINPLIAAPYRALAEAGTGADNKEQAISAYRKLLLLDPADPAETHYLLARLLHERGGAEAEAKRHVLQALEDAPRYRDAQKLLLEIEAAAAKAKSSGNAASLN
jgi:tetratricopeptide (TPR) repeat protein